MNSACKAYAVDLSAYFDNELEGPDRAELEAHLDDCLGCRTDLERMGRLHLALYREVPPPPGRASLAQEVLARLARGPCER